MSVQKAINQGPSSLSPVSAAKREAIVEAATRVFLDRGYGNASMDQIAAVAGVSKQTVYAHFGAKDTLFEAIIHAKCAELLGGNDSFQIPDGRVEPVLRQFAARYLSLVMTDESVTLFRIILGETPRFPELGEAFYRAGPAPAAARLGDFLASAGPREGLDIDNPVRAAHRFFAMMRDDLYMERVLGLRDAPDAAEIIERSSRIAVDFMRIFRTRE